MSKGSQIHKRFGLKFAIAYKARKIKKKIASQVFYQSLQMPYLILHSQNPKSFKEKWRIYRTLRKYKILITHSKSLAFILKQDILQWLESKECKEQYLDTNHPYPPLLNPKNIDYLNIPAELAWEMNLPLPPYYDLIWLKLDGNGHNAYRKFMELCKINNVNQEWTTQDDKKTHYIPCYHALLTNPNAYNLISVHEYFTPSHAKFCALIDKKVPAICNVRDPIETFKHFLNHLDSWDCTPLTKRFNLTCHYKDLFPTLSYAACHTENPSSLFSSKVPLISSLYIYSHAGWQNQSISFYKRLEYLKNLTHIEYIDMSEISKDKAFDTWIRLANQFGFTPPKLEDKYIFEGRINNNTGEFMHFPVVLYAHPNDIEKTTEDLTSLSLKGGIEIVLTLKQRITQEQRESYQDITDFTFETPLSYREIRILIKNEELSTLKANAKLLTRIKEFLAGYIAAYHNELARIKAALITPQDILEYLKKDEHKNLRKEIKENLAKSLEDVQNKRPDIVESWKYYQEFVKICQKNLQ
ncbi:DUF2972 domain-containing protein [Helicobacter sp. MIT 05-5293]|uniref:DUF2972 domain-containing protein n=1 Tax=Helicobacter sp. MIT 05-5293 TaxID=1548149 RepID=UPI001315A326|nr:DUF2972 domain-containing protein [Helicobacter sp. MIT 05-5293]